MLNILNKSDEKDKRSRAAHSHPLICFICCSDIRREDVWDDGVGGSCVRGPVNFRGRQRHHLHFCTAVFRRSSGRPASSRLVFRPPCQRHAYPCSVGIGEFRTNPPRLVIGRGPLSFIMMQYSSDVLVLISHPVEIK